MKLRRLRRVAKWAGAAACAMVLAAAVWTHWRFAEWKSRAGYPSVGVQLMGGSVAIIYIGLDPADPARRTRGGLYTGPAANAPVDSAWSAWWPRWRNGLSVSQPWCAVDIPLWMPLGLLLIPTALLWRLDRRRFARGQCQRCGYDLSGLAAGAACPECGGRG